MSWQKYVSALENEIAKFDFKQRYAAISQINGPQRIRGLAGSGKTIILAMKTIIIHAMYPEKKILYTFYTKSLYDYIKNLIFRFFRSISDEPDVNWDNVHIKHSWGGSSVSGVYSDACFTNGIVSLNFTEAKNRSNDPFDFVCTDLLKRTKGQLKKEYDFVLMDEAQDFKPSFYQLCRELVKDDCLVWAYDELQNILNVDIQDTMSTFVNEYGRKGINLKELQEKHIHMDNDVVLYKCYRNSREILTTAVAIGFGIYDSEEMLAQSLENNDHWRDYGFVVEEGNCKTGDRMKISRSFENSPNIISNSFTFEEMIQKYKAEDIDDEVNIVSSKIEKDIKEQKLRADDIVVICMDTSNIKSYFTRLEANLFKRNILSNNIATSQYVKGFMKEDCITLTSIFKAKGNEAAKVYIMGVDTFRKEKYSRQTRNKYFTAFTRAKAFLTLTGVGDSVDTLYEEIDKVKMNDLNLIFTHKDSHKIKRDLNKISKKKTKEKTEIEDYLKNALDKGISPEEISDIFNMLTKAEGKNDSRKI